MKEAIRVIETCGARLLDKMEARKRDSFRRETDTMNDVMTHKGVRRSDERLCMNQCNRFMLLDTSAAPD
jgi:hypothetical protein